MSKVNNFIVILRKVSNLFKKQHTKYGYREDTGYYVETEFSYKIKIYKKEGLRFSNINFVYFAGNNKIDKDIVDIKYGATYNLVNNKIVKTKLESEGKIKQNYEKYTNLYTVILPNTKVGSVIELKVIIKSQRFGYLPVFDYQEEIPVNNATFFCYTPVTYKYKTFHVGSFEPLYSEKMKATHVVYDDLSNGRTLMLDLNQIEKEFVFKDIPAYKEEVYSEGSVKAKITNELEAVIRRENDHIYYSTTWDDVAKELYEDEEFKEYIKINNYNEILKTICQENEDEKARMVKVFNYIKNKMSWNNEEKISTDYEIQKVLETKVGNVAEINLMLLGFLKAAYLDANPIVINTEERVYFPSLIELNYVIVGVKINNEMYLLDATDKNSAPNILPHRCLKEKAWMMFNNGTSEEVNLNEKALYKVNNRWNIL